MSWKTQLLQSSLLCVVWTFAIECCWWLEQYYRYKIENNSDTRTKYQNPPQQIQNGLNKSTKWSILKFSIKRFESENSSDYVSILLVENEEISIVVFLCGYVSPRPIELWFPIPSPLTPTQLFNVDPFSLPFYEFGSNSYDRRCRHQAFGKLIAFRLSRFRPKWINRCCF